MTTTEKPYVVEPTEKKQERVGVLTELFRNSPLAIITEYRGMTVADIGDLRKQLRAKGAEYHVTKNTLTDIAATNAGYPGVKSALTGPSALAFVGQDLVAGTKVILDYAKTGKAFVVKGGILQGRIISTEQLNDILKLPSRNELVSNALGTIIAPLQQGINVLNAPLQEGVNVLQAPIRDLLSVLAQHQYNLEHPAEAAA